MSHAGFFDATPPSPDSLFSGDFYVGIDVGGSLIKAAAIDVNTGSLRGSRLTVATPQPATPVAIMEAIVELIDGLRPAQTVVNVGLALPSVVKNRRAMTAANIDTSWRGTDVSLLMRQHLAARKIEVGDLAAVNDADAAALAELAFGSHGLDVGQNLMLTFGTGIGSALINDGVLFPNTELGHTPLRDSTAEHWASASAKVRDSLNFEKWAERVSEVIQLFCRLYWPSKIIVGGGITEDADQWLHFVDSPVPVVTTSMLNDAGVIGAARAAALGILP